MANTQSNVSVGGRNRGARKGSETPNPALNIGAGMTPKDSKPAVVLTAQSDPKTVDSVKIDRKTLDQAVKIVGGFHKANDELQTLKHDIDAKRGGLSDICFQLAKLGADAADKPAHRWAACIKVFDSAEAYERTRFQKAKKLADLPNAKEALGSSWQTYKSQILKCVSAGLNPSDFANGTVFREAMSQTGNKARKPRQTAGAVVAAETAAGTLETAKLRTELSAAISAFVKGCEALSDDEQMDFANRLHRLTVAAAKKAKAPDAPPADAQEPATGVM